MPRRNRGTLALLALAGLTLCLAAIAGASWWLHLPHPSQAGRGQLLRWLVLRDLRNESLEVRHALVDRLQPLLDEGLLEPSAGGPVSLSEPHRRQLERNATLLQHDWFVRRSLQCRPLRGEQRIAFLDRQLDTLLRWLSNPRAAASGATAANGSNADFFGQLGVWMEAASPDERTAMSEAVADGLICWLSRADLRDEPLEFRQDLAERLARSLDQGGSGSGLSAELTPERRARLVANGQCLMEAWLLRRAAEYEQLERGQRSAYVQSLLERVGGWDLSLALPAAPETAGAGTNWLQLATRVEAWTERADPEQRRRLRRLMTHLQQQLLLGKLRQLLPESSRASR